MQIDIVLITALDTPSVLSVEVATDMLHEFLQSLKHAERIVNLVVLD
jgi:hypothetical protein